MNTFHNLYCTLLDFKVDVITEKIKDDIIIGHYNQDLPQHS